MTATLERPNNVISGLLEAEATLIRVIQEEDDGEDAAELWAVVEKIQEIIFRLRLTQN